jgi:hypothetical protein
MWNISSRHGGIKSRVRKGKDSRLTGVNHLGVAQKGPVDNLMGSFFCRSSASRRREMATKNPGTLISAEYRDCSESKL